MEDADDSSVDVIIVGGGIAGLAAAWHLYSRAPRCRVLLLEAERRVGGKLLTDEVDGFVLEGGPDSFLAIKERARVLIAELGIEDQIEPTREDTRGSYVLWNGRLHRIPEGLSGLVPGRLGPVFRSGLLPAHAKARFVMDYILPPQKESDDESLASFISRRLGVEAYKRLVEPLMAGIYAGDGQNLSLNATFPQLRALEVEYGGLLRGVHAQRSQTARGRSPFLTLRGGLGSLPRAIERKLPTDVIRTGQPVSSVERQAPGWSVRLSHGEVLSSRALIIATPAPVTAGLLRGVDGILAEALSQIPYASSAIVCLGYRTSDVPHPLLGYGYVIPRAEGRPALACTWVSSKFEHRAPAGFSLLRVFLGRAGEDEVTRQPDTVLANLARHELRSTLHVETEPLLTRIYRWPQAMPQYTLGHTNRLRTIAQRLETLPGLLLAGNAYRGVGIPDCIRSGEDAAQRVIDGSGLQPGTRAR